MSHMIFDDASVPTFYTDWIKVSVLSALQIWLPRLLHLLMNIIFIKRIYTSAGEYKFTMNVLDTLSALPRTLRVCEQRMAGRSVPKVLICSRAVVTCDVTLVGLEASPTVHVVIWYFPWASKNLLVPDAEPKSAPEGHCINVLHRVSNRLDDDGHMTFLHEAVYPVHSMPEAVLQGAMNAATAMRDAFRANQHAGCVFVLHGHPGAGKSTSVRMLTHLLNEQHGKTTHLYADYNPTKPEDNMLAMVSDYAGRDEILVVGYEEFDVSFKRIVNQTVTMTQGYRLDASDKASWNNLLDTVGRFKNVIVVMTTNLSKCDIEELCANDTSLIRKGRVTAHIEWTPGSMPVVSQPCIGANHSPDIRSSCNSSIGSSSSVSSSSSSISNKCAALDTGLRKNPRVRSRRACWRP